MIQRSLKGKNSKNERLKSMTVVRLIAIISSKYTKVSFIINMS